MQLPIEFRCSTAWKLVVVQPMEKNVSTRQTPAKLLPTPAQTPRTQLESESSVRGDSESCLKPTTNKRVDARYSRLGRSLPCCYRSHFPRKPNSAEGLSRLDSFDTLKSHFRRRLVAESVTSVSIRRSQLIRQRQFFLHSCIQQYAS